MNPRPEEIEALARAIDRIAFADSRATLASELQADVTGLISYLNDSFPRMTVASGRRERLERRIARALGLPRPVPDAGRSHLEAEFNRRLANLDPRWGPVVGGTALVLLGVLGFAVWRRGAVKPSAFSLR